MKLSDFILIASDFILKFLQFIFASLNCTYLLFAFLFSSSDVFIQQVTLSFLLLNFFFVFVNRFFLHLISLSFCL